MRILFLPKYHKEGPSSRYRTHNYIKYFKNAGYEITIKPLFHDGYVSNLYKKKSKNYIKILTDILNRVKYLLLYKAKYDVLIIEKELFPYFPYFIERMLLVGSRYTLDFDDAISTRYKVNFIKRILLGNKINKLSRSAILTTVGNKWYWQEITQGKLKYLPTVVDMEKYSIQNIRKRINDIPIIVWIGSPSTVKYLYTVQQVLIELSKEFNFKLRVIGSVIDIKGVNIECLQWFEDKEFEYLYSSDIGIMPLEDTLWERGKCGFKCIQYMASFLPVVASSSPANEEIIIHGETGFIAKDHEDWYEYLKTLLEDKDMRIRLGSKGRDRIEKNYSYQVWGKRYVKFVENAIID
ncbi:glycosyltransferase family 4 protein [Petroclostridium xylanilyticum]|jgi:glycosyltransferase involved in cell wall biosynthesis|uniref:glycosyltransferase family 4 protein n=1 Tax=Petroclostridium xylanilyticum TaxID=1792311 RepID=UPI000B990397|nr:glycosyltransferase family 4 protein [Petroclostridium xylanilyticum]